MSISIPFIIDFKDEPSIVRLEYNSLTRLVIIISSTFVKISLNNLWQIWMYGLKLLRKFYFITSVRTSFWLEIAIPSWFLNDVPSLISLLDKEFPVWRLFVEAMSDNTYILNWNSYKNTRRRKSMRCRNKGVELLIKQTFWKSRACKNITKSMETLPRKYENQIFSK